MGAFNDSMWQSHNQMQNDIDGKAGKGLAGTALGFGIGGTVLSLLGNNGGALGNLFGGNASNQAFSQLQAENAMLKAERFTDEKIKEAYMQSISDNNKLRDEVYALFKPLAEEAANNRVNIATLAAEQKCCCEKQALQAEITAGKIRESTLALNGKIDTMSAVNNGAFASLNQTIDCVAKSVASLAATVGGITKTIVPDEAVCPQPMPLKNAWVAPTNSSTSTPSAAA